VNLADPATLQRFLASQGIKATKELGQHFLCSVDVVNAIVDRVSGCRGVLEIGPGPGVLTGPLAESAERVVAIELDGRMAQALAISAPIAEIVRLDALKVDLSALLDGLPSPRAVVSNLPYYITAPLVERIARARANFDQAVLMMQREVAQRIVAPPRSGERGSLSVFLQAVFRIEVVAQVPASAFLPPPKVDSTVLALAPKPESAFEEAFFDFVRIGFAQPRKTLANNLMAGLRLDREAVQALITAAGLAPLARAQELTEGEWVRLRGLASQA